MNLPLLQSENDELCSTRVASPAYLRDCLEGLAEERSAPVFEAALFALERLIRGRAVGLADLAAQLLQALLFLNDRFHSNDFQAFPWLFYSLNLSPFNSRRSVNAALSRCSCSNRN